MTLALVRQLRVTAAGLRGDRVSIQTLINAHGPATPGTMLVVLAAPCLLPVPGVAIALGIGLAAVAAQMLRGQSDVRLPHRVATLELPRATAQRVLRLLAKVYATATRRATQRFTRLSGAGAGGVAALTAALMAALIVLPIPFGNVPAALALIVLGLGLVLRDGVVILIAYVLATLALLINGAVLAFAWEAGRSWLSQWSGA